ncbi:MAG: gamma-glutamyltransferase [Candidatus Marinimicrobia bacterium]|nr:gamma-glutamyltransferase [Candidatus Neomarinimicrobiota bacterium]MDP6568249.1 gamma-glutamyltransferase [Candidatus Neomarinimicrobiota bacterium]MDP7059307.1 gamma-glutamyltransferase [Candidatus Neomarinimicrobiota bacterium]
MTRFKIKVIIFLLLFSVLYAQRTIKPVLHGRHWMAITGKPLGATAGATIFTQGGNAIDAACAMLAATATMYDVLSWGGETQALIYNPKTNKVIGINALGVAPTGATPEFYKEKNLKYPPQFGPLSAVTPGTPGGLMVMLAEYGSMSLAEILKPSMEMAEGYPIEAQAANTIERHKKRIKEWPYSKNVFLVRPGEKREAPNAGEVFIQPDLLTTLQKLVDAETTALKKGKSRKNAIYAAYDRFYKGDIAKEFVRGTQEQGGLITMDDLANWQVYLEEPVSTNYKGIDVYKLTTWVQGPVMLQALNMIEMFDLKAMGYNSARYMHTVYQAMNHAFADRDFYYGDPYFPPKEPVKGLLSKKYAAARVKEMNHEMNDPNVKPGDPYKFMAGKNPYIDLLETWGKDEEKKETSDALYGFDKLENEFFTGTTSIQTTDTDGWVVSITPSGGWIPTVIAGKTGVGLSQRAQSFVLNEEENPYNVIAPGKRPRATLTPAMALKNGRPFLSFAVQGGDTQDQNLLQFFLNMVEFEMNVQEAAEAANINSYQMYSSFGDHKKEAGRLSVQEETPPWVMKELKKMGYKVEKRAITSGPINAIFFDWEHGSFWGGSSHHGEDYGIAW